MDKNPINIQEDEDITILDKEHIFIQKKYGFRFSIDPVVLCDFFIGKKNSKILDIGTGNGIIPVLLCIKNIDHEIVGIEIQNENSILAKKNISLNKFDNRVSIVNEDVKDYKNSNFFDYVISNPPYIQISDNNIKSEREDISISRHETMLEFQDLVKNAKRLLKPIGSFTFVHRPQRLPYLLKELEDNNFSIKRIKFVHYSKTDKAALVLIEAIKGKKSILYVEPPLFIDIDKLKKDK